MADVLSKRYILGVIVINGMTALEKFYKIQGNTLLLPLDVNWEVWKTRMTMICKELEGIKFPIKNGFQNYLREKKNWWSANSQATNSYLTKRASMAITLRLGNRERRTI